MAGLYQLLYEDISLRITGLLLGLVLLAAHVFAFLQRERMVPFLKAFPRSKPVGIALLLIATIWSFFLISEMDLGEFYNWRGIGKFLIPIGFFLVVYYVPEFLSVRALGVLLLLIAGPVLQAAFLEPPVTRVLLPLIAYVWIGVGMFWIGMPYLLRDWIDWLIAGGIQRWNRLCIAGAAYGLIVVACAAAFWQ